MYHYEITKAYCTRVTVECHVFVILLINSITYHINRLPLSVL